MTELFIKQEPVTLPKDVIMSYQVTVFLTNGDIEEQFTFYEYGDAKEMFIDLCKELPVELTCNVEICKDNMHSETEYIRIAKNF